VPRSYRLPSRISLTKLAPPFAAGTGALILGADWRIRAGLHAHMVRVFLSGGKAVSELARKVNNYSENKPGDPKAVS
jgi:hypothetical protein